MESEENITDKLNQLKQQQKNRIQTLLTNDPVYREINGAILALEDVLKGSDDSGSDT